MTRLNVLLESSLAERRALAADIERELESDRLLEPQRIDVARSKVTRGSGAIENLPDTSLEKKRYKRGPRTNETTEPDILLVVTDERLELRDVSSPRTSPVFVDFAKLWAKRRMSGSQWRADPLIKAVDPYGNRPKVFDATAGFGRDAFVLAAHGCRVAAFERSPIMGYLLKDGFARAQANGPPAVKVALTRLTIVLGDFRRAMCSSNNADHPTLFPVGQTGVKEPNEKNSQIKPGELPSGRPDVVYLDPMFPTRRRKVIVKKELRLCRSLVGDDDDADELLSAARRAALVRVVVKRHRLAEPIAPDVHHVISCKLARFDVYLPLDA